MPFDKKTKRDVTGILGLGIGLGVGTAVEAKLAPAVPVFPQFAPVAAVAGPVVGAGIVIRSLRKLENVGSPVINQSVKQSAVRRIERGRKVLKQTGRRFL